MSGAKFTPGPWSILPNGHCVAGPDPANPEFGISGVAMCGMTRRTEAEARANARLIAAAPELLDALQAVYEALCVSYPLHSSDMDKRGAVMAKARAAMEEATGGAQ